MRNVRQKVYAVLFGLLPFSLLLMLIEERLWKNRVLNGKDLQGVAGAEKGTPFDYATNVWVWDGVIGILIVAGVISALVGVIMSIVLKPHLPMEDE